MKNRFENSKTLHGRELLLSLIDLSRPASVLTRPSSPAVSSGQALVAPPLWQDSAGQVPLVMMKKGVAMRCWVWGVIFCVDLQTPGQAASSGALRALGRVPLALVPGRLVMPRHNRCGTETSPEQTFVSLRCSCLSLRSLGFVLQLGGLGVAGLAPGRGCGEFLEWALACGLWGPSGKTRICLFCHLMKTPLSPNLHVSLLSP